MNFYKLTDPVRNGDVIRAEGRKHYTYSFGPCRWIRTTALMAYLDESSPLYGQYEPIGEDEAQELVLAKNRSLLRQQKAAEARMERLCADKKDACGMLWSERLRRAAGLLDDLEQKITALLQKDLEFGGSVDALREEGISPRIIRAVRLLTQKPGTDYYDYIRPLRRDDLARAAKMADLDCELDPNRFSGGAVPSEEELAPYRAALRYLAMEGELPAAVPKADGFLPAMDARRLAARAAMEGRKVPHNLSNPVLRRTDEGVFLAYFVHLYQKADLDSGMLPRPSWWLLADMKTGAVVRRISCAEEDFSSLAADARLSAAAPERAAMTAEAFQALYRRLDDVRRDCLRSGTVNAQAYDAYLAEMLKSVPPAWRRCYEELSKI